MPFVSFPSFSFPTLTENQLHLFEIYRNTMLGLDETIKKLWITIDSPRTDAKERIKSITLLKECYKKRLELIRSEPSLIKQKKRAFCGI